MAAMSDDELRAFLSEGTRTAKLATVRADGRPHVAPVWFLLDDEGRVVLTTGANTIKGKGIRRDPRVCIAVDDERPPFSFALIDGNAEVSEDMDELLMWATRLAARYVGEERAEAYGKRNAVPGELLVKVTPTHVVAARGITD